MSVAFYVMALTSRYATVSDCGDMWPSMWALVDALSITPVLRMAHAKHLIQILRSILLRSRPQSPSLKSIGSKLWSLVVDAIAKCVDDASSFSRERGM